MSTDNVIPFERKLDALIEAARESGRLRERRRLAALGKPVVIAPGVRFAEVNYALHTAGLHIRLDDDGVYVIESVYLPDPMPPGAA